MTLDLVELQLEIKVKNHLDDAFNITPTEVEVDESDVVVGVDREKPDRLAKMI